MKFFCGLQLFKAITHRKQASFTNREITPMGSKHNTKSITILCCFCVAVSRMVALRGQHTTTQQKIKKQTKNLHTLDNRQKTSITQRIRRIKKNMLQDAHKTT